MMRQLPRKTQVPIDDELTFELERKRVKNVNLRVRRDGTVYVSAPQRMGDADIVRFVSAKRGWIARRMAEAKAAAAERDHAWRDEETVRLWGKEVRVALRVCGKGAEEGAFLDEGVLVVRVRVRWAGDGDGAVAHRARLVGAFLREELFGRLGPLLAHHEPRMGVHASQVRIRDMRSRWGSCNVRSRAITINLELVHRPPQCVESVVVHELCHLLEPSHNARFRALMDRHCPTWRETRRILNARPMA